MPRSVKILLIVMMMLFVPVCLVHTAESITLPADSFPAGYLDSPYVLPDGSAIYFLHSPSPVNKFGQPSAKPAIEAMPGHQATGTNLWFNTDIYVSYRNPDGSYSMPANLGNKINSEYLECCVWVNRDQTQLIFTRESWGDNKSTGNYVSIRKSKDHPWGKPVRLKNDIGQYLNKNGQGIHDLHVGETTGTLYGWSETEGGKLYSIKPITKHTPLLGLWQKPREIKLPTPKRIKNSQPWLNKEETLMVFNRWSDAERELWAVMRSDVNSPWGEPFKMEIKGFADPAGNKIWGEPSFSDDGMLFYTRFNTSQRNWDAEMMMAPPNEDGVYGPPIKVIFK